MRYEGAPLPALQRVHARLAVVRTSLSLLRNLIDLYAAAHTDQATVAMAVFLGHAETVLGLGQPFNVTKLGHYLDIPRPTVGRHLRALTEHGVVERYQTVRSPWSSSVPTAGRPMTKVNRIIANLLVAGTEAVHAVNLDALQHEGRVLNAQPAQLREQPE
jgi:DNA-binding transcriptional ArsR family regulator